MKLQQQQQQQQHMRPGRPLESPGRVVSVSLGTESRTLEICVQCARLMQDEDHRRVNAS